jgi:tetratricopeptide (TPR) repeat protein
MSPEQAELSPLGADTRSDIYSLGVLLYELLTGSTPFDKERLHSVPYDELRRIIREEEPPRPSARISTLQAAAISTIAEHRHTDARRLQQAVRGELDWIVMKCLEKDRNRRYETATSLARDIERYLSDQPVEAGPPSLGYTFRKFLKRNRRAVAIGTVLAAVILSALAATGGIIGWAIRDQQAREAVIVNRIVESLEAADQHLDEGDITGASAFLQQTEAVMSTTEAPASLKQRLADGYERMNRMVAEGEVATNVVAAGQEYERWDGKLVEAEAKYREALRQFPGNAQLHAMTGRNLAMQGRFDEAERVAREAVRLDPKRAWNHFCLGFVLAKQEKFAEAVPHFRADLQIQADHPYLGSHDFDGKVAGMRIGGQGNSDLGQSHLELGWALRRAGMAGDAEHEFALAKEFDEQFRSEDFCGNYFAFRGRLVEAAAHFREEARAFPDDLETAMRAACLLLYVGNRQEYESICQQMLDRYIQKGDSQAPHRICIACLISSEPYSDLKKLEDMSNAVDDFPPVMVHLGRALAAYRVGDWNGALLSSRASRKYAAKWQAMQTVVEAMALQHLGQRDEASDAYTEAVNISREQFSYAPHCFTNGHPQYKWHDWVMFELLRREAKALIKPKADETVENKSRTSDEPKP